MKMQMIDRLEWWYNCVVVCVQEYKQRAAELKAQRDAEAADEPEEEEEEEENEEEEA